MKITKNGAVLATAGTVFVAGLAMMTMRSTTTYDESRHRAEITKVYPSVKWPEYREAAREICALSDRKFDLVVAMAYQDGPEATEAFVINTRHMCPKRLKSVEK